MTKKSIGVIIFFNLFLFLPCKGIAGDKATPEDVYRLVMNAHTVLTQLGDEALPAFNDPKGEFVFKDTYVFVQQCPKTMAAHPFAMEKLRGKDLSKITPIINKKMCDAAKNPNGEWIEYKWPKPGEENPVRKISFILPVEGTPYMVAAGIYNETVSLESLQKVKK